MASRYVRKPVFQKLPKAPYCSYIRIDGTTCKCFAITGTKLCHWHTDLTLHHSKLDRPIADTIRRMPDEHRDYNYLLKNPLVCEYYGIRPRLQDDLEFPFLEDHESIQVAISMVIFGMGRNQIDHKRGSSILYGLQIASSNAAYCLQNKQRAAAATDPANATSDPAPQPPPANQPSGEPAAPATQPTGQVGQVAPS